MRRTTICRFNRAALLALVVVPLACWSLRAQDTTRAAAESYRTIFDRPHSRTVEVQDILRAYANQPYHPVRRGEFYAAGFLTERENLPWGRVLGTIAKPAIPRLTERSTAYQFEQIVIDPPSRVSYHVGDSVLIARVDRDEGDWGDVV